MWRKHNPNNPFACCYGCLDRHYACSDHCEKHRKATKIQKERNQRDSLEKALNRAERSRDVRNAKKKYEIRFAPRVIEYKNGKGTDSPWHMKTMKLPSEERAKARSKTFPGVARALADLAGEAEA